MPKNNSCVFPRSDIEILLAKIHENYPDHALHALVEKLSMQDHKIRTHEDFILTELSETLEDLLFCKETGLAIQVGIASFEIGLTKKNGGTRRILHVLRILANPENIKLHQNSDPILNKIISIIHQ